MAGEFVAPNYSSPCFMHHDLGASLNMLCRRAFGAMHSKAYSLCYVRFKFFRFWPCRNVWFCRKFVAQQQTREGALCLVSSQLYLPALSPWYLLPALH